MPHRHSFEKIVRRRGNRARWQCSCLAMTSWGPIIPVPEDNPVNLQRKTVAELRKIAQTRGLHGTSRMKKAAIIDLLTQVA